MTVSSAIPQTFRDALPSSPPPTYRLKSIADSLPPARGRQVLQRELASRLGYAIGRLESLQECATGLPPTHDFQTQHLHDVERRCELAIASFERLKQAQTRAWKRLYRRTDAAIVDFLQAFALASRTLGEIATHQTAN